MPISRYVVTGSNGGVTLYFDGVGSGAKGGTTPGGTGTLKLFLNCHTSAPNYFNLLTTRSGISDGSLIVLSTTSDYATGFTGSSSSFASMAGQVFYGYGEIWNVVKYTCASTPTTYYSRTAVTSTGGAIAITSDATYTSAQYSVVKNFKVTATADPGFVFSGWTRSGSFYSGENPLTVARSVVEDVDLVATFTKEYFDLTITGGAGGTAFSNPPQGSTKVGTEIQMGATQSWGYTFTNWACTGIANSSTAYYPFTMPAANVTANASFTAVPQVNVAVVRLGTVTANALIFWKKQTGKDTYVQAEAASDPVTSVYTGTTVELKASVVDPTLTYFTGWFTDAAGTIPYVATATVDGTINVPITAARTLYAKFAAVASHTLTVNVSNGAAYTSGNAAEVAGCTLTVQTPPNVTGGKYRSGTEVSMTATAATAWTLTGWKVVYAGGGTSTLDPTNPLQLSIGSDVTVTANFAIAKYAVLLSVDAPSLAVSAGTVALTTLADAVLDNPSDVDYGTVLKATATAASGFEFEGWYENGVRVSQPDVSMPTTTYTFTVLRDITLVAKFTALIELTVSLATTSSGTVWFVDAAGTEIDSASASLRLVIGDKYYLKAVSLSPTTRFLGYFDDGVTQLFTDQTSAIVEGVCTGHLGIVGMFAVDVPLVYLRMTNDPDGQPNTGSGELSATGFVEELTEQEFENLLGVTPGTPMAQGGNRHYSFYTGAVASIRVTPLTDRGFKWWMVRTIDIVEGAFVQGTETLLSTENVTSLLMYRSLSVRAVWVSGVPVRVAAFYATGSDSTMGTLRLDPEGINRQTLPTGTIAEFIPDSVVTMSAVPANGYKFVGWYGTAAADGEVVDADPTHEETDLVTAVTLYAKFEQDANAVYLWEGGTLPKYTTWRSKRFVASAPFDPSCLRVCADGYPVRVRIFACSSPLSPSPDIPSKEVFLTSEKAVRLPVSRKEKYFEIEVSCSYQILEVVLSSSMGGVVQ